jgi:hypothetical protein
MATEFAGTEGVAHRLLGCLHTVIGLGLDMVFAGVLRGRWERCFSAIPVMDVPSIDGALESSRTVMIGVFGRG